MESLGLICWSCQFCPILSELGYFLSCFTTQIQLITQASVTNFLFSIVHVIFSAKLKDQQLLSFPPVPLCLCACALDEFFLISKKKCALGKITQYSLYFHLMYAIFLFSLFFMYNIFVFSFSTCNLNNIIYQSISQSNHSTQVQH